MIYKVIISNHATLQLDNIIRYVLQKLENKRAAQEIMAGIESAFRKLERHAEVFALCDDQYLSDKGYRKYILEKHNYVIIYKIENEEVLIAGIFHMKENYADKL